MSDNSSLIQVILVFVVVLVSLLNLSLGLGDAELWRFLLLTFVGIILPSPAGKLASFGNGKASSARQLDTLDSGTPAVPSELDRAGGGVLRGGLRASTVGSDVH